MRRPVIGITMTSEAERPGRYVLPVGYASSVEREGGLPWPIPFRTDLSLIGEIVDQLDGLILSGGNDPDPSAWGEPWHPKAVPMDPVREAFDRALLAEVERRRRPILGICLGAQLLNVHRGGSLMQFLPDVERENAVEHRRPEEGENWHGVRLAGDSLLSRTVGLTELEVNSRHRQGISIVGRGLKAVAWATDGIIEAVEDPSLPLYLGVQWHPEMLPDRAEQRSLFGLLLDRARCRRGEGAVEQQLIA